MQSFSILRIVASVLLIGIIGSAGCSSKLDPTTSVLEWGLSGTVWMFTELEGQIVGAEKIPTLQLELHGNRVKAFGGINRMNSTYQLDGSALSFSPFISTRMSGAPKQMSIEAQFQRILSETTHYRIEGYMLNLMSGEKVLARGQATVAKDFATD